MKISTLQKAVGQIELNDVEKQQMIRELKKDERNHGRHRYGSRAAIVVAACIIAVGIVSVPVRALVSSLVRERMEKIPKEEIKTTVEQLDSQKVDGDGYTRPYTEGEKAREKELYEQYVNGTFPAGEIPQVDSEEEAKTYEFCFLIPASVFYLPADRELTDEEILQKIDFEHKRNYALRERYEEEHAKELAAKEQEEQEQITQAVEAGGVTEEQAVEIARDYFKRIYGLDESGLELNHYYDADAAQTIIGQPAYSVNWSDIINNQYYYFWIGVADGRLLGMSHASGEFREQFEEAKPAIEEAPDKISQIKEQAERFLTDKIGIQETYDRVRTCYQTTSEGDISSQVGVLFVKADGTAYLVDCSWDGVVNNYSVVTEGDYEEQRRKTKEVMSGRLTEEYGREVTMENVWN